MAQFNKTCKICLEVGHSKFYCKKKPFKPIPKVSKKKLKQPKRPVQEYGTRKEWEKTKAEWKKLNPPDEYGYWYCKFGGGRLDDGRSSYYGQSFQFNMCHDKSRARYPSLKFELSNLFAGCGKHNKLQGSMSYDEFLAVLTDFQCGNY